MDFIANIAWPVWLLLILVLLVGLGAAVVVAKRRRARQRFLRKLEQRPVAESKLKTEITTIRKESPYVAARRQALNNKGDKDAASDSVEKKAGAEKDTCTAKTIDAEEKPELPAASKVSESAKDLDTKAEDVSTDRAGNEVAQKVSLEAESESASPETGVKSTVATRSESASLPAVEDQDVLPACEISLEEIPSEVEIPEELGSRMQRLRSRLANSGAFGKKVLGLLSTESLSNEDWEDIETTLLMADLGVEPAMELVEQLRTELKVRGLETGQNGQEQAQLILRELLLQMLNPQWDRSLNLDSSDGPASVLVVGVNGTGKTTTVGKIARVLVAENKKVLLGAADTFRAAAAEQLSTWGERVGVEVVRSPREGGDPAAVAFEALERGKAENYDVVLVDTAGRLQNKAGLMDELGKIKRVMSKHGPINEVLLVIDATTGQNGLSQAKIFGEVVGVTGVVLTKIDGTAKGGIVVEVQRILGAPVKFVGLGEGPDDLAPFVPEQFVDALLY